MILMKLLILTQYFPPETGAPQNRLFELAQRLRASGVEVAILTAMPNYPKMEIFKEYEAKRYVEEEMEGMKVYRTSIYVTKSKSIRKRLMNYFSFVYSSFKHGKKLGEFDFILCESPPLFLGYSAMKLAKRLKAKLIFNVSDLWPESAEKLGLVNNRILLKMAYRLEKRCYHHAHFITGQTQGIVANITQRFPEKFVYWLPNGVDLKRYDPAIVNDTGFRSKYKFDKEDIIFFYGGILGHAQGLEVIIKAAAELSGLPKVKFVLMGDGPLKKDLIKLAEDLHVKNVTFAEPVSGREMAAVINEVDASIVPLRKLPLFLGAIPSKIFEVLAMEKPILLGVQGEAKALFIDEGQAGWAFEPESVQELKAIVHQISLSPELLKNAGKRGRQYVQKKFNRDQIASDFYQVLKERMTQ